MRSAGEYRNHSPRARRIARLLDLIIAPFAGCAGAETRRGPDGPPPERILLIRPDHAGDLLMATPAIRALRRARPHAVIDLLASPWGAPAAQGNPDLDRVLTIEATWFEPGRRDGPDPTGMIRSLMAVRRGRYEAAGDLRGDFRSILIARASGARRRAGFSRLGLGALLTDCVPFDPRLDHIARNHAVVQLLGAGPLGRRAPIFAIPPEAEERARRFLAPLPDGSPIAAVFPGTNRPGASWGPQRFGEACRRLRARRKVSIVIGGREADAAAAGIAAAGIGGDGGELLDLSGRTSFAEAAAVIRLCSVLLANDSGAAHLGVAVRTPVAVLFGPTDPATLWTWDGPERYRVLAGPSTCERPCFDSACGGDHGYSEIQPAEVAALMDSLIDVGREEPAP